MGGAGFSAAEQVHSRTHALQQTSRLVTYWITSSARVISRSLRNTRAANRWQRVVRRQVGFLDFPAAEQEVAATKRAGASPRTPIVHRVCINLALPAHSREIRTISETSFFRNPSSHKRRASVVLGAKARRLFSENLAAGSSSLSGRSGPPRLISTSSTIRVSSFVVTDRIAGACCGKMESQRGSLVTDILRISARRVGSRTNSSAKSSTPSPRPPPPIRVDATV